MKRFWVIIILFAVLGGISYAAAPNKETNEMIIFTDNGQSTTSSFRIQTVAWEHVLGSTPINANCGIKLAQGDGTSILELAGTSQVVAVGGINTGSSLTATKTGGLFCGKIFVYGQRR